jgi:ribonuclease PH
VGCRLKIVSSYMKKSIVLMGVVALFIEVVKASRSSMASAVDHALSALVFAAFLVEFLLVKAAGTGVFLVLTIMSFLDLIAGFTVTLGAARWDLTIHQ